MRIKRKPIPTPGEKRTGVTDVQVAGAETGGGLIVEAMDGIFPVTLINRNREKERSEKTSLLTVGIKAQSVEKSLINYVTGVPA